MVKVSGSSESKVMDYRWETLKVVASNSEWQSSKDAIQSSFD
jgi:hypothetical protein